MSDVTTGSIFNPQFFMNPPWWMGRVEEKETWEDNIEGETFTNVSDIEGWGHRYKVRIFNWHTGELDTLPPKDMAFCQVVMPVTAGSGHGGGATTPSIESGSVVFGFFMDGMPGQEGYIMGVLGNSNNNVPKKRGEAASNQTKNTPSGSSSPPAPTTGPGSLSNVPLSAIPNVDQLSSDQLNKLLDPSRTPSSAEFRSASEARERAKSQGLPAAEVERLVKVATVRASREPGATSASTGNCNQGYQQFGDTYTDGDEMRAAKVPDDRTVASTPLSVTEAQHIRNAATEAQDTDMRKKVPLLTVCKEDESELAGIQLVMQNLLNDIESLKKQFNQISAFATGIQAYTNEIQTKVSNAIEEISGFLKNLLIAARGSVLTALNEQIDKITPLLFPTLIPDLYVMVEEGMGLINCLFNALIDGLIALLTNLLSNILDNLINAPLCAAKNLISDFVDSILGPITSTLQAVLAPINALVGGVTSLLGSFGDILDLITGILRFFLCDQSPDCIQYTEISQGGPALPSFNFNLPTIPSIGGGDLECQTGPVIGGPPFVGIFGQTASGSTPPVINPIISPISSSVIGFDIINPGSGFLGTPTAVLIDPLGNGSGSNLQVNLEDDEPSSGETDVTAGGTGGTSITVGGTGGTLVTAGGTPVTAGGTPVTAGGTGGTSITVGGTGGTPLTSGGTPVTAGGTPLTAGGTGGTSVTVGGTGGTPVTAGGTPVTTGGNIGRIPVTTGGNTGGIPLTSGGTPVTAGGTPVTAGGTGGVPVTSGGTPVTAGGTGGTPVTAGGVPVTSGGTPVTAGGTGGTPVTAGGVPVTSGGTGGVPVVVSTTNECDVPRAQFEKVVINRLSTTKKIKSITILAPGNGYLSSPNGSLGGGGRVWKEPDEGYVRTKCGGYYVVQPYRPIPVKAGDTYYPPDGIPVLIEEDQIINLPLVPVSPPKPETFGLSYPVILCVEEIKVLDKGFGYRPGDQLIITPDNGTRTELIINQFGNVDSVKILQGGCGFLDFPQIKTNSPTGFNATFTPIFKVTKLDDYNTDNEEISKNVPFISVIDCVGKIMPKSSFDVIPR